ncbi:MAG: hypothetical protein HY957_08385 [Nitrospirae bacterium]|nr:hypothetical protein [Nitrospirota bacterium]
MVKNSKILRKFEREETKREKLSFREAIKIVDAMWHEALALGVIKRSDWLADIEKEIRIARIANGI